MNDEQQTSYLDLPDDEFGNAPVVSQEPEEVVQEESAQEDAVDDVETQETVVEQTEADTEEKVEETTNVEKVETSEEKVDTTEIDYKAAYERLTAPFKANGKEVAVTNVDDAIALMQMGANYNKKMAGLKPHLKVLKMLEKHGLMDESKLSYLIDLNGKNPEAIAKLVKDSGLDPMEMDTSKESEYKPKNYRVDDREIELDNVLEEIKDSPTYQRTLSTVSNDWDEASKQVVAATPQLLKVINSHMETGIYDLIQKELEKEKLFGRLDGLSDIEAYKQVGNAIQSRGGFDFLAQKQQNTTTQNRIVPKPVAQDEKLKDKKRAAAPAKPAVANTVAKDFNPLSLSDEEFSKLKPNFM